ncbi:MAG: glycosyltransferase family 2 protein [Candidatus Abyssubacteria bacterium]
MKSLSGERVSVIIPNYNGRAYLNDCLGSLLQQTYEGAELIVVDNGSSDGSIEFVAREYSKVRLVALESNRGYSAAVNAGFRAASGDLLVVLNNDTRAEPEFIGELCGALREEHAASMAAPKMLFSRAPDTINSAGLGYSIRGTNHDLGFGLKDGPDFQERRWIFGPCGGAGAYRRSLFEDIGGFDEDFFMYYEDVDYSFRAQLAGHKCVFVPGARIYHAEGGSGASLPEPRNYYFARNSLVVILKDFPARLMVKHAPAILWEVARRAGSPLLRGDSSAVRGYVAAVGLMGAILRKRRWVQRQRRVPDRYIEEILKRNRSVVKEINLKGRPVEERP